MRNRQSSLAAAFHFVHEQMIWFLLASYVVAAVFPGPGLWLRGVGVEVRGQGGEGTRFTLPMLLLAVLLLNAGLGMQADRLRRLVRRPVVLAAGVAANLLVPVAFILAVSLCLRLWHNTDEAQYILVGLAVVASMPIAGSSTAWTQNVGGDLALSLGLVVLSTGLSPVLTPLVLHACGWMATGTYADGLHQLAAGETSLILGLFVLLPCLAGVALRGLLGGAGVEQARSGLRGVNLTCLLVLCYCNAAAALPSVVAAPDWDFLAIMLVLVFSMCAAAFWSGWAVGWVTRADRQQRTALMFGLGMNNNGTAMVVAATALASLPMVLLPVLFYNLVQHLVAGAAHHLDRRHSAALAARTFGGPALGRVS